MIRTCLSPTVKRTTPQRLKPMQSYLAWMYLLLEITMVSTRFTATVMTFSCSRTKSAATPRRCAKASPRGTLMGCSATASLVRVSATVSACLTCFRNTYKHCLWMGNDFEVGISSSLMTERSSPTRMMVKQAILNNNDTEQGWFSEPHISFFDPNGCHPRRPFVNAPRALQGSHLAKRRDSGRRTSKCPKWGCQLEIMKRQNDRFMLCR